MKLIVPKFERPVKRRILRVARKAKDANLCRRALSVILIVEYRYVAEVAEILSAARSTIYRWIEDFNKLGEESLQIRHGGHPVSTFNGEVRKFLIELISIIPHQYNYLRSTWTSKMLANEIYRKLKVKIHASTVRRKLRKLGYRWNRARPTLFKCDPQKKIKLEAIKNAIENPKENQAVLYVDESEVCFNPRIGYIWTKIGKQQAIPTPGVRNEKSYLGGALNAHNGKITWTDGEKNNTELFLKLLNKINKQYKDHERITVIMDNYCVHKSKKTNQWLDDHPKFAVLFQPIYYPWCNRIERLWKALHDTITRNHRWGSFIALMDAVYQFMEKAEPFPGAGHGIALLN